MRNHKSIFEEEQNFERKINDSENTKFDLLETSDDHKLMNDIFNEFKNDAGKFEVRKFIETLKETDAKSSCKILLKKIEKTNKNLLSNKEFKELFSLDWKDPSNFQAAFELIDDIGNSSGKVSLGELQKANSIYELGLSNEDMEVMIKYVSKNKNEFITLDELMGALNIKAQKTDLKSNSHNH